MDTANDNSYNKIREFGEFRLDTEMRVLWHRKEPVNLQPKEIELLTVLTEKPGDVVTKRVLLDRVWADSFVEESNLSRHIYRIREVFESYGLGRDAIKTVPRRGYRFTVEIGPAIGTEIVVERHSYSTTVVEELDISEEPASLTNTQVPAYEPFTARRLSSGTVMLTVVGLVALAAIALAAFNGPNLRKRPITAIAILPFHTLGTANNDPALGTIMAESIIGRLSNIAELSVRPASAVRKYERTDADVLKVAAQQNVDGVIEGSIFRSDDRYLVSVRLVTNSNETVWSRQIEADGKDIFDLQSKVAIEIVEALSIELSKTARTTLTKRYSENADALRLYQLGRYQWNKRNNEGLAEGLRLFRNAAEKDPKFALAYVGIADSLIFAPSISEASVAIEKAIALDPNLGEAYATRGFIKIFHQWEWNEAEADLRRAVELNPGYVSAHQWLATLLMIRSRPVEAQARLREALRIDPLSYNLWSDLAQAQYFSREYAAAEKSAIKAIEIYPDFLFANLVLSDIYLMSGRYDEAVEQSIRGLGLLLSQPNELPESKRLREERSRQVSAIYRSGGIEAFLRSRIDPARREGVFDSGLLYGASRINVLLKETGKALDDLELAVERRSFLVPFLNVDPVFDPVRDHPRFVAAVERMGLR